MASLTGASGEAQGNRHGRRLCPRAAVFKRGEPCGHDPNPDDLRMDKMKRAERHVEVC